MASANYAACLKIILQNEGGYVNNPKDPGGETNYGITKSTARAHGYTGNMHDIPMSVVERIYRGSYWKGCDDLPSGVDLCVFDFAVNSGPGRAWGVYKAAKTINGICDERLRFLRGLRTWATFGAGWSRRVELVRAKALKMAAAPAVTPVPAPVTPTKAPDVPAPKPGQPSPVTPTKPAAPKVAPSIWTTLGNLLSAFFAALSKK